MKTIVIVAALLLAGMAAPAFGQVAQPQQLPDTTIPTQCIDLNQDRICEAVVLMNGTLINFTKPSIVQTPTPEQTETQSQTMGKCHGFQNTPTFCKDLLMPNGEVVQNKTWTYGCNTGFYEAGPVCSPMLPTSPVKETQAQTVKPEPEVDEAVGSSDGGNGDSVNPYCDKVDPTVDCWDRKDYYQGGPHNGLYPCNDGSNREDWRDCPDASDYDYESNDDNNNDEDNEDIDTGGSNPEGEEEDQSCGGESCTDDEKEDSWTDEDAETPPFG
jgi:hypothetical protein